MGSGLDITSVLKQSIKFQRSDAICWSMFYMGIIGEEICNDLADEIIETGDCLAMAMLLALKQHQEKVVDFLNTIDPDSYYHCDQYWILLHELASDCPQFKRYRGDSGLKILIENKVHFIQPIDSIH